MRTDYVSRAYKLREVAELLGVSKSTVERTVNRGELKHFRVGQFKLVSDRALQEFIEKGGERQEQPAETQ
jgi:excisionase family DNA binding protein